MRNLITVALCTLVWLTTPLPTAAQSADETAFVTALMRAMNQLSVRFNREVCGFVLRDADGRYSSTKVSWGGAGELRVPAAAAGRRTGVFVAHPRRMGARTTMAKCPRSRTSRATWPWA
jgi:hypothetical protein